MTDATAQQPIPGLEADQPSDSAMVKAARRTIRSLEAAGYLDDRHSILTQQLLELAKSVDAGARQGKASATAMAAAQIVATYQVLVPEAQGGDDSEFDELVAELRRSATAPRNTR